MAADPLNNLRLSLMQQALPVGVALAQRLRRGGPSELAAAFGGGSADPLEALRQEGEPTASRWRARLDRFSPGLGNPVMSVEVREVEPSPDAGAEATNLPDPDPEALPARLSQIASRLSLLERRLLPGP